MINLESKKFSLLRHRFVREIQQVTGGHFLVQVSVVFIRFLD